MKTNILKLRIDWSELDYFGHVNNVSFYKYIQSGRVALWDTIGLREYHLQSGIGPMLASCRCDFKQPLFFPGEIEIHTSVLYMRNSSFSFRHQILNASQALVADAEDVMVMFDFNKNEKVVISEYWRNCLSGH